MENPKCLVEADVEKIDDFPNEKIADQRDDCEGY